MSKSKKSNDVVDVTIPVDTTDISRRVVDEIVERIAESEQQAMRDAVRAVVQARVEKIGLALIDKEIDRVFAEGWQKVDTYGARTGGMVTVRERISEMLSAKQYSNDRSMLERMVAEKIDAVLKGELKPIVEAAKTSLRTQVDGVLSGIIKAAVAQHIGLKA